MLFKIWLKEDIPLHHIDESTKVIELEDEIAIVCTLREHLTHFECRIAGTKKKKTGDSIITVGL